MKKYTYLLALSLLFALSSCNDDFLDRTPLTGQSEASFRTYTNFQMYAWQLYHVFHSGHHTRGHRTNSRYMADGDRMANWLMDGNLRQGEDTPQRLNTWVVPTPRGGGGWDFAFIRNVNIMLRNLGTSEMNAEERAHWRAVGYFFFSYRYIELLSRFGDVTWVPHVLRDDGSDDDILFGPRMPRKEVADSILARLQFAEQNIRVDGEGAGTNTINRAVVQALISRFALFEGTWRRYHNLGDETKFLEESLRASEALMATFPTIDNSFDGLFTSQNLRTRPGTILFKEYSIELLMGNYAGRWERSVSPQSAMHRFMTNLYLVQSNGLPVTNADNATRPDVDMFDEFRDRDPRLLMTVVPPYSQRRQLASFVGELPPTPHPYGPAFSPAYYSRPGLNNREFIDLIEQMFPDRLTKRLPTFQFQGNQMMWSFPHFRWSVNAQMGTRTGYTFWRHYSLRDLTTPVGGSAQANSDKPIFFMEEVLLNAAEAAWELGKFNQAMADRTINRLRSRTSVNMPNMVVANITAATDPSNPSDVLAPGRPPNVDPVLWEIRRERIVELMGNGFGWNDIRRWRMGEWFLNRPIIGAKMDWSLYRQLDTQGDPLIHRYPANATAGTPGDPALDEDGNVQYVLPTFIRTAAWNNDQQRFVFTYHAQFNLVNRDNTPVPAGEMHGYMRVFPGTVPGWNDRFYLFPLPADDLRLNPSLIQNPGWEGQ